MKMSEFLNMDMGELGDWIIENGHDYTAIKNDEHDRLTEENAKLREENEELRKDKFLLIDAAEYLHKKLIVDGKRYGASINRKHISKLLEEQTKGQNQ